MSFSTREPAVVDYVRDDNERGQTTWVGMKGVTGGWGQGFGQLILDDPHMADWKASIAALFGVSTYEEIVSRQCFVLRNWDGWGADIEGLEVDGKRFTITDFRRKHWPEHVKTQLENKAASIRSDIQYHARRIQELVTVLERLREGYVEWATPAVTLPSEGEKGTER